MITATQSRFSGPPARGLCLGLVISLLGLPALAADLNREWAEAMIALRKEYREKGVPKPEKGEHRGVPLTMTARLCRQMLADHPRHTDWLLQDCGNNLEAWFKQTGEPAVEKGLLGKIGAAAAGTTPGDTDDPGWLAAYAEAAESRRDRRLERVRRLCPRIVFTKNHTVMPSFFAYTEGQSDAQSERHFTPGTALCLLDWEGGDARVKELIVDPCGRIRDPEVSFDGKKILFSWKKSDRLDDYHLYELAVETGEVRQLTDGLGVADFEPCYLPNGDIVFSSSRCVQTVDCYHTEVSNLYTCGPGGEHLRRLGFDQVHTVKPALLPSGQVVYTRWDYNDRGQVYPQGLFQMNQDGAGQTEFYGNNSWFPTTLCHARGIPGSSQVVAVAMGHHTWQAGKLILLDVARGRQENAGAQLIAPVRDTEAVRVDQYGQEGDLFQYPWPLNEREFLVACNPLGGRPGRFSIYYMDIDGNRELLASDPAISCQHPAVLQPRERPPVRPSLVDHSKRTGIYYMQDVYIGPGLAGVERGTIKKLRVVALEFRAADIGMNFSNGPAGGALASTPVSVGNGAWDVKRVVGDATVYPDGSAYFEAPARTPLYFQCLDENNRAVQTMRSWSTLQPGEKASCVGCHEDKDQVPLPQGYTSLALRSGVQKLEPFYGESRGFSFPKEIQPILDAKCVECHRQKGEMDLSGAPVVDEVAKRRWNQAYLNLTGAALAERKRGAFQGDAGSGPCVWVSSQSVPEMIPPRSVGSMASPMIDLLLDGHGELNRQELDKFIAWIDLGVPYCGDYREANAWTADELAKYDRFEAKRERFAALENAAPGPANPYRNIAREAAATANSEYGNLEPFAARNVIDGDRGNRGHGKRFPSWGPDKLDDLWLQLEWSEDVFLDRIHIFIRADFEKEHDSWWKTGTLLLSSGRKISFSLEKTAGAQVIEIPVRGWPPEPLRWIRFTGLVPAEDKWCGFSEVEVMGRMASE